MHDHGDVAGLPLGQRAGRDAQIGRADGQVHRLSCAPVEAVGRVVLTVGVFVVDLFHVRQWHRQSADPIQH